MLDHKIKQSSCGNFKLSSNNCRNRLKNERAQKLVFIRHNLNFPNEPSLSYSTLAESDLDLESNSDSDSNLVESELDESRPTTMASLKPTSVEVEMEKEKRDKETE